MRIAVAGSPADARLAGLVEGLVAGARARGHEAGGAADAARLVVNVTSVEAPAAHWRRTGLGQFAVSLVRLEDGDHATTAGVLSRAYPALLKTLSNAVIAVGNRRLSLVTPELGVRPLEAGADGGATAVLDAVLPLAATTFAIENDLREDLDPGLAASPAVAAIREGGRRLASLGLLPSVVRMEDVLTPDDLRLLRAVFGLQQISYGNLSTREPSGGFWMTGRGVDKSRVEVVGRDVLLVTGHDEARGLLRVSVPTGRGDGRVSVDALEHALVYEAFPEVGAIVHAHAWIDGIAATRQNWPCGSVELARDVRDLVAAQRDPASAEVGLRNHGVTLCGPSIAAIFERVEGRLVREVPAA